MNIDGMIYSGNCIKRYHFKRWPYIRWTDKQFVDFILIATSPSTIYKGKDSTSLEEVISVPVDKQQTEEQSGEDESELFKETHSVGPGNLSSFEITIIFKRTQDHV